MEASNTDYTLGSMRRNRREQDGAIPRGIGEEPAVCKRSRRRTP